MPIKHPINTQWTEQTWKNNVHQKKFLVSFQKAHSYYPYASLSFCLSKSIHLMNSPLRAQLLVTMEAWWNRLDDTNVSWEHKGPFIQLIPQSVLKGRSVCEHILPGLWWKGKRARCADDTVRVAIRLLRCAFAFLWRCSASGMLLCSVKCSSLLVLTLVFLAQTLLPVCNKGE